MNGLNLRAASGRSLTLLLLVITVLALGTAAPEAVAKKKKQEIPLSIAKVYFEYNASANDLGVHIMLDGEDWKEMKIYGPHGTRIFEVAGKGPYKSLGMTELFFEGAEPSLDEFPLEDLLDLFPQGEYEFEGKTVDGDEIEGVGRLSHAIPDGPEVEAEVGPGDALLIRWDAVHAPPEGFPDEAVQVVGYQVIVGLFQVTLPATADRVTVPPEFVAALASGVHAFEVLAIDRSGNQSITEGTFTIP